jgi:SpoVK/Ycf46/Vps4 family AAA+-type ATPase
VIQCSQLGTDEEKLEKNLRLVLKRATRWKAVLLIDECDVYVRARGEDLQQNAIVGIFLRVLEYYKGVLFLTSNRGMIVDDAIMSRVTAHVKYEHPTQDELLQIWDILCDINKIQLSQEERKQLVQTLPNATGRNVKMLLKLFQRMKHRWPEEDNLKLFQRAAKFVDMPERNPMAAAA